MDRVFEKSQPPSPSSKRLKRILLGKQKRPPRQEPQYFPYGGGGDSADDLASQFNSYEPEELMVDSRVPIEDTSLDILKRNARKILVSGSRYDVPENPVPPNSRNTSYGSRLQMPVPEALQPVADEHAPLLPSLGALELPAMPKSVTQAVDFIRRVARDTVVLRPLDSLADVLTNSHDSWGPYAVAAVELWLLMLALNIAAVVAQLACAPAVWVLKLCLYFVK